MDNFHIDITSEGDVQLERALLMAFNGHSGGAIGYAVRDEVKEECYPADSHPPHTQNAVKVKGRPRRLVFFWSDYEKVPDFVKLPFKLDAAGATDFARRWLAELDFGKQPDHDGDNGKAWRVYCEGWGMVDNNHSAFVAIAPAWAMYGK